ncbi:DUF6221 family protein [Amycolatopsis sp. NPDC006131]|uniref:DUF6221 family protein n=1 Tax=Amycolatopsis sp. NPDC006131 TaxID=3156731 RepID=UPI0033B418BA
MDIPALIAFLRARLAALEARAEHLHDGEGCSAHSEFSWGYEYDPQDCDCGEPDRARAHVEATRRRIDWCAEVLGRRDLSNYGQFGALKDDPDALAVTLAVEILRLEALPYASHYDYREEWRP